MHLDGRLHLTQTLTSTQVLRSGWRPAFAGELGHSHFRTPHFDESLSESLRVRCIATYCNTAWRLVGGSPSKSSSSGDSRLLHSCFMSSKHLVIESYLKHIWNISETCGSGHSHSPQQGNLQRHWNIQSMERSAPAVRWWDDPPRWTDQETPSHWATDPACPVALWTLGHGPSNFGWPGTTGEMYTWQLCSIHIDSETQSLWSHYDHIMITLWSHYDLAHRNPKRNIPSTSYVSGSPSLRYANNCQHIPTLARLPQSVHHLERPYAIHVSTNFVVPPALQTWRDGEIWTSDKNVRAQNGPEVDFELDMKHDETRCIIGRNRDGRHWQVQPSSAEQTLLHSSDWPSAVDVEVFRFAFTSLDMSWSSTTWWPWDGNAEGTRSVHLNSEGGSTPRHGEAGGVVLAIGHHNACRRSCGMKSCHPRPWNRNRLRQPNHIGQHSNTVQRCTA